MIDHHSYMNNLSSNVVKLKPENILGLTPEQDLNLCFI